MKIIDKLNNKIFNVYVGNTNENIIFICEYINEFFNLKAEKYIGIDFEFKSVSKDKKDIALMQINFEISSINEGVIFIIDPKLLNKKQKKLITNLLCNKHIIKILHGGEALDIPYLINNLLDSSSAKTKDLLYNLVDTKYLCEYHHIINNVTKKCSIYDLYLEFNVINKEKYSYLSNIENIIGPIHTVEISINNLNTKLLEYVVYDVLYLCSLYNKLKNIKNFNEINGLCRLTFYYKRIPSSNYKLLTDAVVKLSETYIKSKSDKIKMVEIYQYVLHTFFYNSPIYNLLQITYFKNFLENILKYIVYMHLININRDFIDKIVWDKNIKNLIKHFETKYLKKY
jgi:hypothetical protein